MSENREELRGEDFVPSRVKSFSRRGGRMVRRFDEVMEAHSSDYVIALPEGPTPTTIPADVVVDLREEFGRSAPLIVEIGPGSGEQLVSYAERHPEVNILAVEAWHPGVARCVARAVKAGVTNIRLLEGDAAQILPIVFGLASAGHADPDAAEDVSAVIDADHPNATNPRAREVWTFFPDPWRKARHRKRRLVAAPFAGVVAGVLEEGGLWRLGTDWNDYAWQMRDTVEGSPYFQNVHAGELPDENDPQPERGGFSPRWEERVMTRFEQRGIDVGRHIHDITACRVTETASNG